MEKTQIILIGVIGFIGHFNAMVSISQYLIHNGYHILFVTSSIATQIVKKRIPQADVLGIQDRCSDYIQQRIEIQPPLKKISNYWKDQIIQQFIGKRKVSLILSDFMTIAMLRFAKKLKIKLAINIPGPLEFYSIFNFPNFKQAITFAGFTILLPQYLLFLGLLKSPWLKLISEAMSDSLVFVNSFFGLNQPIVLPPNFKMTGALINSQFLPPIQNQLQQWLNYVRRQNLDIIYVTFGSIMQLTQSFFEKLYYDLKETKKAVLWAIPSNDNVLPQRNPRFFTSKWLPQITILKLQQVKVVLTHCGWNGVIQCIYHQKPMLCCPGSADQPMNAQLVKNAGIGLILRPQIGFPNKKPLNNSTWTTQDLIQKVEDLVNNKKYKNQLKKLKGYSEETGGFQTVLKSIQNYIKNGNEHLIDKSLIQISRTSVKDTLKWIVVIIICYVISQCL